VEHELSKIFERKVDLGIFHSLNPYIIEDVKKEMMVIMRKEVKINSKFNIIKLAMKRIIQVKIYKGQKYYVAECLDLPVVSQGKTLDEVVANIKEAIDLHLEGEDLRELDILPDFSILINLEIPTYAKA